MKIGLVITAVVIALAIFFIWDFNEKQNQCNSRAQLAAIENYPISEYPDTSTRESLQASYVDKYKESCQ